MGQMSLEASIPIPILCFVLTLFLSVREICVYMSELKLLMMIIIWFEEMLARRGFATLLYFKPEMIFDGLLIRRV